MVVPVPVMATVCGLPAALSAMLMDAVRAPVAVGLKVTLMVQVPAARTEVQVLVCVNSVLLVPVTVMPVTVRVALPVLVSVTVLTALATLIC